MDIWIDTRHCSMSREASSLTGICTHHMTGVQRPLLRQPCRDASYLWHLAHYVTAVLPRPTSSRKGDGGICCPWLGITAAALLRFITCATRLRIERGSPRLPRWLRRRAVQCCILGAAAGRRAKAAPSRLHPFPGRVQALQHIRRCLLCDEYVRRGVPTARRVALMGRGCGVDF